MGWFSDALGGIVGKSDKSDDDGGNWLGPLASVASGLYGYRNLNKAKKQLQRSQERAEGVLNPYMQTGTAANKMLADRVAAGFSPDDLKNDPGYKFRVEQGNQALDRSLGARGGLFSGAAIKAGQEYGQGVADQTYNDAFQRWSQVNDQLSGQSDMGLNAAGALAQVYDNQGNIGARVIGAKNNLLSRTLSDILSGRGPSIAGGGGRKAIGVTDDGSVVYDDDDEDVFGKVWGG